MKIREKLLKLSPKAKIITACVVIVVLTLGISLPIYFVKLNKYSVIAEPIGLSKYEALAKSVVNNADYYVSVNNGNDSNDGKTIATAFKTIEFAKDTVKSLIANGYETDIVVAIAGGDYIVPSGLIFDEYDTMSNGTVKYVSYDENEVVLSGGINLPSSAFKTLTAEQRQRFYGNAADNIVVINLFEQGLTQEQIGKLYAIGGFAQGVKYGDDDKGHASACEVYFNDERMTIARYPNEDYAEIKNVIDYGEAAEHAKDIIVWNDVASPRPPKFTADKDMRKRMQNWQMPTDQLNAIWAFGYFYWDWADASSPVTYFDAQSGEIDLKYSSPYGIQEGAKYYIYNVLEELDTEGEYYIDRVTGDMYIYPTADMATSSVEISITTNSVITVEDTEAEGLPQNLVFENLTIKDSRSNGITVHGRNVIINNCLVKNVADNGINVKGFDNTIKNCEITSVGKNSIYVGYDLNYVEGDISNDLRKDGLVIENNLVTNNYLHNYGVIQKTYTAGVYLTGVGNVVSHNEITDAPHMGIYYCGNEHLVEYNYIHNVVLCSSDAGAIYAGRNFTYYGNVLRYNCISTIGSGEFTPAGIYFDDCLQGQTAYGNILINIPSYGFLIGGGRYNNVYNNLIINAKVPISYDARAYDGQFNGGWYTANTITEDARQWKLMKDAFELYSIWKEKSSDIIGDRYDGMIDMTGFNDLYADNNAMNPNSTVTRNICISKKGKIGDIADASQKYSSITNNKCYKLTDKNLGFVDFEGGDYNLANGQILTDNPNFELIPISSIGRTMYVD